jgi:lipopolysaccharide export system permease protein
MKTIDRYILRQTSLPLAAAVGVALLAMLLEKLVHVLDLVVNKGGPFVLLLEILADLIPPYLGLALPASLFAAVLLTAIRLSGGSELDAMQAGGVGLARLMLPIMAIAVVATAGGFLILGVLQPRAFYSYRSLVYLVTNTVWDATLERGDFFTGFGGRTILVDHISGADRQLSGIFIYEPTPEGGSVTISAQSGTVYRSVEPHILTLHLLHGARVDAGSRRQAKVVKFEQLDLPLDPDATPAFIENRGDNIRELTLSELWHPDAATKFSATKHAAELNGRLVRIASFLLMPALAFPLGIGSRRSRRGVELIIGTLMLVVYNHVLQFGGSLTASGRLSPIIALWLPFLILAGFSGWSFYAVCRWPGEPPLSRFLAWLSEMPSRGVVALRWRNPPRSLPARGKIRNAKLIGIRRPGRALPGGASAANSRGRLVSCDQPPQTAPKTRRKFSPRMPLTSAAAKPRALSAPAMLPASAKPAIPLGKIHGGLGM